MNPRADENKKKLFTFFVYTKQILTQKKAYLHSKKNNMMKKNENKWMSLCLLLN